MLAGANVGRSLLHRQRIRLVPDLIWTRSEIGQLLSQAEGRYAQGRLSIRRSGRMTILGWGESKCIHGKSLSSVLTRDQADFISASVVRAALTDSSMSAWV